MDNSSLFCNNSSPGYSLQPPLNSTPQLSPPPQPPPSLLPVKISSLNIKEKFKLSKLNPTTKLREVNGAYKRQAWIVYSDRWNNFKYLSHEESYLSSKI